MNVFQKRNFQQNRHLQSPHRLWEGAEVLGLPDKGHNSEHGNCMEVVAATAQSSTDSAYKETIVERPLTSEQIGYSAHL